jgi:hypothetical protein
MAATFSSIQTRVKTRLIDTTAAILVEVPQLVQDAYTAIQRRHNFKVMDALASMVTTVGNRTLAAIPSDLKEWKDRPYRVDDNGIQWPMIWAPSRQALNGSWGEADIGFSQALYIGEEGTDGSGSIEVWPLPDGNSDWNDGEYRVYAPYRKYLADLVADGDTSWLVNAAELYLIAHATASGFALNWDEQRAMVWAQTAEMQFAEVRKADKRYRLSGFEGLFPSQNVNGSHLDR